MNPRQFEELVCEHFRSQGYKAETTTYTNDYGVDVFAIKGKEKIAVQAKMYGGGRKINRHPEFEYYHVNIFDDGNILLEPKVLVDAFEVSAKTLYVMDNSIKNMKKGIASKPVNFKKYLSAKE